MSATILYHKRGFEIYGDEAFSAASCDGTIITTIADNQDCIIQIGIENEILRNFVFKNISFVNFTFNYNVSKNKFDIGKIKTSSKLLYMVNAEFGITDNLFFWGTRGQAFKASSIWEIYFGLLNFRKISNPGDSIMCFAESITTVNANANITACVFEKIMFENTHGNLIKIEKNSNFANNHFGIINFEPYYNFEIDDIAKTELPFSDAENFNDTTAKHWAIFECEGNFEGCNIESIEMNNFTNYYYTKDEKKYIYDIIMNINGTYLAISTSFNNVLAVGMNKDAYLIKQDSTTSVYVRSCVNFNNIIINNSERILKFDVDRFSRLNVNNYSCYPRLDKEYMSENFLPFYDRCMHIEGSSSNYLMSDNDSLNKLKLIVTPPTNQTNAYARFITSGNRFWFRAKIHEGIYQEIWLTDKNDETKYAYCNCLGTGKYKWYSMDLSNFTEPTEVYLRNRASTSYRVYFDVFKFDYQNS